MKLKGLTEVSLQIWAAGTHEEEFIERMGKNGLLTQAQNQFLEPFWPTHAGTIQLFFRKMAMYLSM